MGFPNRKSKTPIGHVMVSFYIFYNIGTVKNALLFLVGVYSKMNKVNEIIDNSVNIVIFLKLFNPR